MTLHPRTRARLALAVGAVYLAAANDRDDRMPNVTRDLGVTSMGCPFGCGQVREVPDA